MTQASFNIRLFDVVVPLLKQGYGVEDIAVLKGLKLEDVRGEVTRLRKMGFLAELYGSK